MSLRAARHLPRGKRPVSQVTSPRAFRTCSSERRSWISKSRSWGKIKNVGHARVSLRQCSVLLSYTARAVGHCLTLESRHTTRRISSRATLFGVAIDLFWGRFRLPPFPSAPALRSASGSTRVASCSSVCPGLLRRRLLELTDSGGHTYRGSCSSRYHLPRCK